MARSPVKLKCEWIIPPDEALELIRRGGYAPTPGQRSKKTERAKARGEFQICRWACVGPLQAAKFVRRRNPNESAIVHPSTKEPGSWQVSYFDEQDPWSDTLRKTCSEAVALLEPWAWRLRDVR